MGYLEEAIPYLERASRVIVATDNDAPGDFLRRELENRIGVGSVAHIRFPEGVKDANDALQQLGVKWIWEQITSARPTPASGVFTPMDILPDIEHALKYGFDTGTRIGYSNLDEIYRPTAGHLTIVTGHAGVGKSTVLDNFFISLAMRHHWPIAYFSPEQMPLARHLFNLAEIYLNKPVIPERAIKYNMDCATHDEVLRFIQQIQPLISHINPEMADEVPSLDHILELGTAEVRRNGIKGLVLDPWNEIEVARPNHVTETEWVSIALGKIRRWARKHNVHVWLIAHPKKMRSDEGIDAVPGLSDISGSIHFRNKADYGLSIYNPNPINGPIPIGSYGSVTVRVVKARWRDSAVHGGEATFAYNPATNRIFEQVTTYADKVPPKYIQDSLY
jgi:twinkle protein